MPETAADTIIDEPQPLYDAKSSEGSVEKIRYRTTTLFDTSTEDSRA